MRTTYIAIRTSLCNHHFDTMPNLLPSRRRAIFLAAALTLASLAPAQTPLVLRTAAASALDAGPMPAATPMQLTLSLAIPADRAAALDTFLAAVASPASPLYHQWLTPTQFAAQYGAPDTQIAAVTAWLTSGGLTVSAVSPGKTRLQVTGTSAQVASTLGLTLRQFTVGAKSYYANASSASISAAMATLVTSVSGLDNLPPTATVASTLPLATTLTTDPFTAAASAIDANTAPILTFNSSACSSAFVQADYDAYTTLFRQASAQGITVLASSACAAGTGSFPASLAEATAVTLRGTPADVTFTGIAARPPWQTAPGIPTGVTRLTPDLTTPSLAAFAQTLASIASGNRLGNVNATLYSLAAIPGLYTQPDDATPGTWEPATGLGNVDLAMLARIYPRGVNPTSVSLNSSIYGVTYSEPFTLTSTVTPSGSGSSAVPTGTIVFSAAVQGTLATVALSGGTASFASSGNLPIGTYVLSANYSGDTNYAAASSSSTTILTISQATATIAATLSPTTIAIGSSSTLAVTVTLPYTGASPTGNVTATVNGIAGAVYTGTLTPVAGGGAATASIPIPAPAPGTYTVQTTCAGSANFQCPTPATPSLTVSAAAAGNTTTALTVSPTTPAAGQTVTLTAILTSAITGTPTGTITFTDNGVILASAPVSARMASASVTLPAGASQMLTASYSGDATFNPSTSPAVLVSVPAVPSTVTLKSTVTSALSGASILLTAQVSAGVVPTGAVTFSDTFNGATTILGTAKLSASGTALAIAQISTSALLPGAHQVSAAYAGDANSTSSASPTIVIAISDYTLVVNPTALTLTRGQTGSVLLTVTPVGSFTGNVSFLCSAPAATETSCSIQPGSLTGSGTVKVTITTSASTQSRASNPWKLLPGIALAFFICGPIRRRRLPTPLLVVLALALTANLGCGSGAPSVATDPGSPVGTSLMTISTAGTDGVTTVTHDFQFPVTLQ